MCINITNVIDMSPLKNINFHPKYQRCGEEKGRDQWLEVGNPSMVLPEKSVIVTKSFFLLQVEDKMSLRTYSVHMGSPCTYHTHELIKFKKYIHIFSSYFIRV
jgi:hypothetical protein